MTSKPNGQAPKPAAKVPTEGEVLTGKVVALARARNSMIVVRSPEETRVVGSLVAAGATLKLPVLVWDCVRGVRDVLGNEVGPGKKAAAPGAVLETIETSREPGLWVLKDFHDFWKAPKEKRALRNLAISLLNCKEGEERTIVCLCPPGAEVPPEFQDHHFDVEWKLPDRREMAEVFRKFVAAAPDTVQLGGKPVPCPAKATPPEVMEAAIDAAMGLSAVQAQNALAESLTSRRWTIDQRLINDAKKAQIKAGSGVDYQDPDPMGLASIGGLDPLKEFVLLLKDAYSEEARTYGLGLPKGILLVGVPGCGKSLTAKCVPAAWQVPLLRFDVGGMMGGIVGETESRTRRALSVIDAIDRSVVLIDEIEKMFGGATGGALDSGVSSRQFGAVLSWMEDRTSRAFIIATANDVSRLPPELLRRFDAIFFVDLPTRAERREILRVALKKSKHEGDPVDLDAVVRVTDGFTGAEVVRLVSHALYLSFADGRRPLATADVVATAKGVVPLSQTMPEKVKAIRDWASTRAKPASAPDPREEVVVDLSGGGRALSAESDDPVDEGAN